MRSVLAKLVGGKAGGGGGGVVVEGSKWKDVPLLTLDGFPKRLFDYAPKESGRPLVLNFGSWT